eukprot:GHVU01052083.1.p2 GENE.GHVU01052083.1~~GHVU01052083.1.p2  ORF type:complete len:100 (-),score=3.53 GHVU01052083.1:73-372(-)
MHTHKQPRRQSQSGFTPLGGRPAAILPAAASLRPPPRTATLPQHTYMPTPSPFKRFCASTWPLYSRLGYLHTDPSHKEHRQTDNNPPLPHPQAPYFFSR